MPNDRRSLHIVHTEASCGWGGQEIRILEESRGLIARGHRVTILAPAESTIFQRASEWGVTSIALPLVKKRLGPLLALRGWLKAHAHDVDLINTHSSTDSWLAALAVRMASPRLPIVRTRHISAPVHASAANRWLYATAAAHVVTTGEQLRRELIDNLGVRPDASTSIPTGMDTTRYLPGNKVMARAQLGLDVDAYWIGIVATLRSWKGHTYLLEALTQLPDPRMRLLIVGQGPQREALGQKVRELGLEARVHFAGEQKNVVPWLQALDVFALPSYANEGVSQAVMQAMLVGLPIVTTPVGSMRDIIENRHTGLIIAPKNAGQLADAIESLHADPGAAQLLGERARTFALEHCSLTRMLDRMEAIFLGAARPR
ncbi:glycosyltransferase family 4 protein [Uliginosibacterium sp. H3]|uniref:Glycosyltransferase family 4 protein n=1 Tax=Uliginosibacterium silvisoli TaxID=3114758 RepID=A0ABU6K3B7_9RHOO|nr:glycosyltransferase family 4 protein [Uliginosibacterium sp. H3]